MKVVYAGSLIWTAPISASHPEIQPPIASLDSTCTITRRISPDHVPSFGTLPPNPLDIRPAGRQFPFHRLIPAIEVVDPVHHRLPLRPEPGHDHRHRPP